MWLRTHVTALRMTWGRWIKVRGSKGAPAFPPPYTPSSIILPYNNYQAVFYTFTRHPPRFPDTEVKMGVLTLLYTGREVGECPREAENM